MNGAERVIVSNHAAEQAAVRFPEYASPAYGGLRLICREVDAALREGRKAKSEPRWVCGEGERRRRAGGRRRNRNSDHVYDRNYGAIRSAAAFRYVWNPEQTRCYLIRKVPGGILVITCIAGAERRDVLEPVGSSTTGVRVGAEAAT